MAIWEIIRNDHTLVESLFEKIDESDDADERADLIAQLRTEFLAHAEGEEKAVYPQLRKIESLKDKIDHGAAEHQKAKQLLQRVVTAGEDEQMDLLAELEEAIQDHVEEEEEEIIPVAEEEIDEDQAEAMLKEFEAAKNAAAKS
jgi:hemerythrin superfamily protein